MAINKFSPGCCCGNVCPECVGTVPSEFDFTTSGLSDTSNCNICDTLDGSFTVRGPYFANSLELNTHGWGGAGSWPRIGDAPDAFSACIWHYTFPKTNGIFPTCTWSPTPLAGFNCFSEASFTIYGYTLAKFTMLDPDPDVWRLVVEYQMTLTCSCAVWGGGPPEYCCFDEQVYKSNWFWEHTSTSSSCGLSGSESWSLTTPPIDTYGLNVTCDGTVGGLDEVLNESLTFADFCTGSLSLSSKPTSE